MKPRLVLAALAALGCAGARVRTSPTVPVPRAEGSPALAGPEVTVRAREAPLMPVCVAADPVAVARLTAGVPASPSLARRDGGGVVVFVTDREGDGRHELDALPLDAEGAPTGAPLRLHSAEGLASPVAVASGEGYAVVWREGAGPEARLAWRRLGANGAPTGDVTPLSLRGWLGAPAMLERAGSLTVAVTRSAQAPTDPEELQPDVLEVLEVGPSGGAARSFQAPDGGAFEPSPPLLVPSSSGVRVYTTLFRCQGEGAAERALVRLPDTPGEEPTLLARDLDHPAALALPGGVILGWRARVARHDAAVRAVFLPDEGEAPSPPVTLATLRGAFGAEVALAPLGEGVGAFTLSTLADDAGGSLNVSLVTNSGEPVGRAPLLTSFLTRAARASYASLGGSVWVAADGRDVDGSGPELILSRVSCDAGRQVDPLEVPPGTMVQSVADPDAASVSLSRPGGVAMTCTARATGTFARHLSGAEHALEGSSSAAVALPQGAAFLAVVRASAGAPSRLAAATLDARGRLSPLRYVLDNAGELLAAEAVGEGALAAVTWQDRGVARLDLVGVRPGAVTHGRVAGGLRNPTSAVIVSETGHVFVTGEDDQGDAALFLVSWTAGRAGPPVMVARLRPGDLALDVAREGRASRVLVERADPLSGSVGRAVAVVTVADGARTVASDPFVDPLGHPREGAWWAPRQGGLGVVYSERGSLRLGEFAQGELRRPRSVLEAHPGGGSVLSSSWSGGRRWLALSTGDAGESQAPARPVSLAVLGEDGAVRGVTSALPDDASALSEGVSMGASGDRVVLLHARTQPQGGVVWVYTDAACVIPGGGR